MQTDATTAEQMVCYWAATMVVTQAVATVCCLAEHWVSMMAALWVLQMDAKTAESRVCCLAATMVWRKVASKASSLVASRASPKAASWVARRDAKTAAWTAAKRVASRAC